MNTAAVTARSVEVEAPGLAPRRLICYRNALLLALFAPGIAELLSSSAPPLEFFIPWIFALFVLFYGCSAVLIREFSIRWDTGWRGILLLGAGFGILQEGIATRAFFDPNWGSLGPMAGTGYWLGVNWVWMFDAIFYHAVFSTALPVLLVYQISPEYRRVRWLGRKSLLGVGILFTLAATVFLYSGKTRYPAKYGYLIACSVAIGLLCLWARRVRAYQGGPITIASQSAGRFTVLAFAATLGLVLQIYALPQLTRSPWVMAAALALLTAGSGWLILAWSGGRLNFSQNNGLLAGSLGCFALLSFFQEVSPARGGAARGMSLVGIATLTGLYFLWKKVPASGMLAVAGDGFVEDSWAPPAGSALWRLFEIVVALCALAISSPIILLLTMIVRRGTPGRALFFQDRVGIDRKLFRFVKFRTLYVDARQRFPELYRYQYSEQDLRELKFKVVRDPRVTPQGRWLRTITLDELPNFWNVLTGDMALVGPRPEIPEMLPYYTGEMLRKFDVRPGITGLAQISGRGRLGFYETVDLDLEYVKHRSLSLDLKILALTAYKIVTRDGAF